jgi:uncharacterized protein (DUF427 family)
MMKVPGPDHPITIGRHPGRVRVTHAGRIIADTRRALVMMETTHPPRYYIPREDADMAALQRTSHSTHCPYKGDAAYFSIATDDRPSENAIWTYEAPFPAVADIKDHLAFYSNRVDAIEVDPAG